jgi:subtilisin family serine protease
MAEIVEIIVKYNGDINAFANQIGAKVEILSSSYAIMQIDIEMISILRSNFQIEYFEYSSRISLIDSPNMNSSCVTSTISDPELNLNGEGVIVAILDSGIDFKHPDFIDDDGKTRILAIWDQDIEGNPPTGFNIGTEYTQTQINQALESPEDTIVLHNDFNGHGTAVAGITAGNGTASNGKFAGAAPKASILCVKLATNKTSYFTSTSSLMRGVKYAIDVAIAQNMPLVINISYGNNQGSHDGSSLFEQYLDSMSSLWKTAIVVATGNEGVAGHHFAGKISTNKTEDIQFVVRRGLTSLVVTLCKSFTDIFEFQISNSAGETSSQIDLNQTSQAVYLGGIEVIVSIIQPTPYYEEQQIFFFFHGLGNSAITENIWMIKITGVNVIEGYFNVWLPVTEIVGLDTKFLNPSTETTLTIPSTAAKVITVGGYDSFTGNISEFSGRGYDRKEGKKPDIVAPDYGITAPAPGGLYNSVTGTSFAAPHVSGSCALAMQWGIVKKNNLFLYGQRLKAFLRLGAKRKYGIEYPNNMWGYGTLCIRNTIKLANEYTIIDNNSLLNALYYDSLISSNVETQISNEENSSQISQSQDLSKNNQKNNSDEDFQIKISPLPNPMPSGKNPITSEKYLDYLINYDHPTELLIKDASDIFVSSIIQGDYAIAHVPIDKQEYYHEILGTQIFNEEAIICGLNEDSNALVSAGISAVKTQPYLDLRGESVIVGLVDTGIDFTNKCFIYENDKSKILYLWDQTLEDGQAPLGFEYGVEFTKEQIDEAIADPEGTHSKIPSQDENGHGTFLASIIAGRSYDGGLEGAAPDASIIAVKLKPAKKIMRNLESIYNYEVPAYESTDIIAGVEYIYRKAIKLGKPVIINLALSSNNGAHDGLSFFERYLSAVSLKNGVGIFAGVGNEGNGSRHFETRIENLNSAHPVEFNVESGDPGFMINIWTSAPDRISISLQTPSGNTVERRAFTVNENQNYNFVLEGTKVNIEYVFPDIKNGNQNIIISLINPTQGLWILNLFGDLILDGNIHGWMPVANFVKRGTIFLSSDVANTVTIPSTSYNLIGVGAYNSNDGGIYISTGRGPALPERTCPDFVAPGVNVNGIFPSNRVGTMTGTSVASAVAAGAAVLVMQWGIVQGNDKALNTLKLKSYLLLGSRQKNEGISYPDGLWGYGELNLIRTFQRIR